MEITPWMVYWIAKLDTIRDACIGAAALLAFVSVILLAVGFALKDDEEPEHKTIGRRLHWHTRWVGPAVLVFWAAAVFTPTTKQMVAILVVPAVANNEDVQGLGSDLVTLAREWMQELRPKARDAEAEER